MKKYKVILWKINPQIMEIEVERETDSSVWSNGRRMLKNGRDNMIFDSWDEAKDRLLQNAEIKLASARRSLESAQGYFGNCKGLKE